MDQPLATLLNMKYRIPPAIPIKRHTERLLVIELVFIVCLSVHSFPQQTLVAAICQNPLFRSRHNEDLREIHGKPVSLSSHGWAVLNTNRCIPPHKSIRGYSTIKQDEKKTRKSNKYKLLINSFSLLLFCVLAYYKDKNAEFCWQATKGSIWTPTGVWKSPYI